MITKKMRGLSAATVFAALMLGGCVASAPKCPADQPWCGKNGGGNGSGKGKGGKS